VQPLFISYGKLEGALVSRDDENFPHAVQQYRTASAKRQVLFDFAAQIVVQIAVYICGKALG
jgi:hypothetical protein